MVIQLKKIISMSPHVPVMRWNWGFFFNTLKIEHTAKNIIILHSLVLGTNCPCVLSNEIYHGFAGRTGSRLELIIVGRTAVNFSPMHNDKYTEFYIKIWIFWLSNSHPRNKISDLKWLKKKICNHILFYLQMDRGKGNLVVHRILEP